MSADTKLLTDDRGRVTVGLALLSAAAGSMDAIAFVKLGNVFVSAMTGNTILLGLAIGQGQIATASKSLTALIGYMTGVAGAAWSLNALRRAREKTLVIEACLLALFAGLWNVCGGPVSPVVIYLLIALAAVAMGLQGALGRSLGIPGVMTVIFTSTYTAIVGTIAERVRAGKRPLVTDLTWRQVTMIGVYLASAALSGLAISSSLDVISFVPLAAVGALVVGLRLRWLRL